MSSGRWKRGASGTANGVSIEQAVSFALCKGSQADYYLPGCSVPGRRPPPRQTTTLSRMSSLPLVQPLQRLRSLRSARLLISSLIFVASHASQQRLKPLESPHLFNLLLAVQPFNVCIQLKLLSHFSSLMEPRILLQLLKLLEHLQPLKHLNHLVKPSFI